MHSSSGNGNGEIGDDDSLQCLLSKQLMAVQKVLEFNHEITQRLKVEPHLVEPSTRAASAAKTAKIPPPVKAEKAALTSHPPGSTHKESSQLETLDNLHAPLISSADKDSSDGSLDGQTKQRNRKKSQKHTSIFPDAASMKEQVKQGLFEPEYSVEDLYHETGWAQSLARNQWFQNAAFLVIGLNTIWLAVDTDYNIANDIEILTQSDWWVIIIENLFCGFFAFEITTRFLAFQYKCSNRSFGCAFSDAWFCFDFVLVSLMVWETWVLVALIKLMGSGDASSSGSSVFRVFRLLRLTRVARLARLMHGMPELMILVKGMIIAMRSVFSTLLLLLIIVYVFAILFTQTLAKDPAGKDCFETVPDSINCLLLSGIFADQKDIMETMLATGWLYGTLMYIYLIIAVLLLLNMLIGVICEVVGVVAATEKEESDLSSVRDQLLELLPELDADGDGKVSMDEFKSMVDCGPALRVLANVGVDVYALIDFADNIFDGRKELEFQEFMEEMFKFRETNTATLKDLADMRKYMSIQFQNLDAKLSIKSR